MKTEKNKDALKITNQFRAKNAMVYDLKADGNRLTVRVFPRERSTDSGEWRVEARTNDAQEEAVVAEWGATRAEALGEVAKSWVTKAPAHGLPMFDWEAVAQVLTSVRAL